VPRRYCKRPHSSLAHKTHREFAASLSMGIWKARNVLTCRVGSGSRRSKVTEWQLPEYRSTARDSFKTLSSWPAIPRDSIRLQAQPGCRSEFMDRTIELQLPFLDRR
jgi:hypothetical protein